MSVLTSATTPARGASTAAQPRRPLGWATAGLSLSMLLPSLNISIANVGLPTMAEAFDASFSQVQWIVIAYLLAITTLIVGAGRLGDIAGKRRLLLGGIGLFTVATLLCGIAPTLPLLIAARSLQGVGAACMMALTMAFVSETVPRERTGSAMGLLGTMSAIGTATGPSLGGLLITGIGWRAIFLISVPLGALTLLLAVRVLPTPASDQARSRPRFDSLGTLLLALTLGAYALAMTIEGEAFGPLTLALLVTSAAGLVLFVLVETRVPAPLLRLSLFRNLTLTTGLTTSALVSTVMMTTLVVGPFHLARALGLAPVFVGLVMSAGPVVSALTGVPAGRAADRFGADTMVVVGLSGVVAGTLVLSLMPVAAGVAGYALPLVTITASYGRN